MNKTVSLRISLEAFLDLLKTCDISTVLFHPSTFDLLRTPASLQFYFACALFSTSFVLSSYCQAKDFCKRQSQSSENAHKETGQRVTKGDENTSSSRSQTVEISEERSSVVKIPFSSTDCVEVYFPTFCVLGNRTVHLELVEQQLLLEGGRVAITPILYIAQKHRTPFLKRVKIRLPLNKNYREAKSQSKSWIDSNGRKIQIFRNFCWIEAFSFSPVGLVQDLETLGISAMRTEIDERFLFDESKIYFLMKQVSLKDSSGKWRLDFDCRSFRDWQEHDAFRWKTNWSFIPIIHANKNYHLKKGNSLKVQVNVESPSTIKFDREENQSSLLFNVKSRKEEDDHIVDSNFCSKFYEFQENLDFERDALIFDYRIQASPWLPFVIQKLFAFLMEKIRIKSQSKKNRFPILPLAELREQKNAKPLVTEDGLIEFMTLLGSNWMSFMTSSLGVPKHLLGEFILEDIHLAVKKEVDILRETGGDISEFKNCHCKGFESVVTEDQGLMEKLRLVSTAKYENFKNDNEPELAKNKVMLDLGVALTVEQLKAPAILEEESVRVLCRIMMYVDHKRLKTQIEEAVRKFGLQDRDVSDELRRQFPIFTEHPFGDTVG